MKGKQRADGAFSVALGFVVPCHFIMSHYLFFGQVCMMWRKNADALNLVLNARRMQKVSAILN